MYLLLIFYLPSAETINSQEIITRLARLEEKVNNLAEGQKRILREMDKRFEAVDKRFEDINNRFDNLVAIFIGIVSFFRRSSRGHYWVCHLG
jgi:archaellum component FlaC